MQIYSIHLVMGKLEIKYPPVGAAPEEFLETSS